MIVSRKLVDKVITMDSDETQRYNGEYKRNEKK